MAKEAQVERTRGLIFGALEALLKEKPYDEIPMTEIAERAGVTRQAIYYNYKTKDALAFACLRQLLAFDAVEQRRADGRHFVLIKLDAGLLRKNRSTIASLLSGSLFWSLLGGGKIEAIAKISRAQKRRLPARAYAAWSYSLLYQTVGCFTVLGRWMKNGMKTPAKEIERLINSLGGIVRVSLAN
jgi:AcrR family transcriptional regulator